MSWQSSCLFLSRSVIGTGQCGQRLTHRTRGTDLELEIKTGLQDVVSSRLSSCRRSDDERARDCSGPGATVSHLARVRGLVSHCRPPSGLPRTSLARRQKIAEISERTPECRLRRQEDDEMTLTSRPAVLAGAGVAGNERGERRVVALDEPGERPKSDTSWTASRAVWKSRTRSKRQR